MTALQELNALWRSFPNSDDYAVSRDMAERYEEELVANIRFCSSDEHVPLTFPIERFKTFTAKRLPMTYRGKHLTLVEAIA